MSIHAPKNLSSGTIRQLNRLIVADLDEGLVLDAAARVLHGPARRRRLLHQGLRRSSFRDDLAQAIVALHGVPAKRASFRARASGAARRFRQMLTGGHEGDAYAASARATEKTIAAYHRALRLELPADVRRGVERHLSEIESDSVELNRLRFGAFPAAAPAGRTGVETGEALQGDDARALGAWSDEGGAARKR